MNRTVHHHLFGRGEERVEGDVDFAICRFSLFGEEALCYSTDGRKANWWKLISTEGVYL